MNPIRMECGHTLTKRIQIKEDGVAKDLTGATFQLAAKEKYSDTTYKIGPINGTVDLTTSIVSFVITAPATPFNGKYSVVMTVAAATTELSTPGGDLIVVSNKVIA